MSETEKSSIGKQNEGSGEQTTRAEESKQRANTMVAEGIAIDDIVKETGLKKRTLWSLKGALARAGNIPTRNELETPASTEEGGRNEAKRSLILIDQRGIERCRFGVRTPRLNASLI